MVKTVNASPLICALKGALAALIVSIISLPVSAWILSGLDDPDALIYVVPKAIQIISGIIGGIVTGKCRASKGIVTPLLSGAFYSSFIILGIIISGGKAIPITIMLILTLAAFLLGSLISAPKEKSSNAKRKEMLKKFK